MKKVIVQQLHNEDEKYLHHIDKSMPVLIVSVLLNQFYIKKKNQKLIPIYRANRSSVVISKRALSLGPFFINITLLITA